MSSYNLEYNKDEVVLRYVIVALLADLRDRIYFFNYKDEAKVKINVPFFYSVTGNERFLLDAFLFGAEDNHEAVGDYDVVPRGIIALSSAAIDAGSLTNKFVRTEFIKEFNGELKTFSLNTMFVPMLMGFNCTVITNSNLEMFKATESLISKLYKNNNFYVDLGGFQVQATFSLPEDFEQEKLFEFGLNDKKEFNVKFPLEVRVDYPVFEGGILLSEIDQVIRVSQFNPDLMGVGVYRDGGIYFGNIIEKFDATVDDIRKSPVDGLLSNQGYNNLPDQTGLRPTGPIFGEDSIEDNS
jgi:hypothetical protein